MSKADASDEVQRLAGSLIVRVTDLPVSSAVAEV